jgi:hypothetical protein
VPSFCHSPLSGDGDNFLWILYELLMGLNPSLDVNMGSLAADYVAFDRCRTARRQYVKAFGGMALVVLSGAVFGRVPVHEAWIVAGLLLLLPLTLLLIELVQRHRLFRRLNTIRAQSQEIRKS